MNQYATRLWASLLTLSLLLPLAACGRDTTTATTMYLKRTEGTVTVSDSVGKDVPLLENLGLYSGYGVDTSSESYAWISLDDVKLTKMDQESEIAIQKEGKNLEIEIKSGSLFFNVTQPLENDETMDIRTSTMLIGIRGTCGWMEDRDGLSREYILEGTVECSAENQTVQVNAGEMAELMADGNLVVQPFTVQDIPSFVLDDLVQDPDLCSDIYDASGLDVLGTAGRKDEDDEQDFGDDILAALKNAKDGKVITLTRNYAQTVEVESAIVIFGGSEDNPVVLDLNGHTLSVSVSGFEYFNTFSVYGALQIRDSSGTGDGRLDIEGYICAKNSAYLFLDSVTIACDGFDASGDSIVTLNGGGIVRRVTTSDNSIFSVMTSDNSTFTMNDGRIDGAVSLTDNSSFTMNDGTIDGSVAPQYNSTFTMNGGTIKSFATQGDSTFIMNGGTIDGNVTFLYNSTFTMYGGTINGGAFQLHSNSTFTLNGGTIESYIEIYDDSTFIMGGGTINSDDVLVMDNSNFTMYDGTIENYVHTDHNSNFTMYNGMIEGYYVSIYGNSIFTMYGGTIDGNVEIYDNSTFTQNGGTLNGEVYAFN